MRELNQRRLRYFYEVFSLGSIRAASSSLNTSPSVVTRQIQLLEEELNIVLFERHSRGLRPTEGAHYLLDFWRGFKAQQEQFEDRLSALRGLKVGNVHVAISEGYVEDFLSNVVSTFSSEFPGVTVKVDVLPVGQIVASVLEGVAQIGIAFNPESRPELSVLVKKRQPVTLLVRSDHEYAVRGGPVTLAEAVACPLAVMPPISAMGQITEHLAFAEHLELKPTLITNSLAVLREYVLISHGATFTSGFAAFPEIAAGRLTALLIDHPLLRVTEARLIVKHGRPLGVAAEAILRSIRASMRLFSVTEPE
jgi:DNA-binding transcriptional LysR family regulator